MPDPILVVIDGHYYAYRFFFGMPPLSGPGGRPTGVSYAFAKLLKDLHDDPAITHWACTFDTGDSFRHQVYPEYKAHRDPMPPDLARQLPDVERVLAAFGMPVLRAPGFEADDTLFTLARRAESDGCAVRLLTKDKDVDQALSARVCTWDPGKKLLRGPAELTAEKGIRPEQVVDYLCMIGDTADNVPGIMGVGPKTAAKWLAEHGSLDQVIAKADTLSASKAAAVRDFVPKLALTRDLILLREVPGLPACAELAIDRARTIDTAPLAELGFALARLGLAYPAAGAVPAASSAPPLVPAQAPEPATEPYRILALADLPAEIERLRHAGRFALDTETTGLDPLDARLVGISLACGEDGGRGAAYLPLAGTDGATVAWADARPLLAPLLADPAVRKFGQNIKFDWRVLHAQGAEVAGYDGDVMLASWLLDPSRASHGLDHLTENLLGEPKIPTSAVVDLKAGQTMDQVPVATVARYACEDAQCTWRLGQLLEARLAEHRLLEVYRTQEVPLALCLARLEHAGLGVDREALAASERHLAGYLAQVEADLRRQAGEDFNPASPKQVAALLFGKLGLPVISSTKSGPSTDAHVLEALRAHHELPDLLLQFRTLSKLLGSYLTTLPGYISAVSGRIHTHLRQTGTETGRLASDQPNLQNIPKKRDLGRDIRGAFAAPAARVLIAADYSQIELRVLAHLSGDAALCSAFHAGADIHRFVAAQVAGVDEAAVTPAQRNAAKAVNFGIIYGQTAFGLAQQLGIPRGQAQAFIDGYFNRFASVKGYINRVVEDARACGYATTMAGRRRFLPQLASGNRNDRLHGERIALNTTIQGSAADLIKRAMLRCEAMLPAGARLVLQIHDELLVEADEAVAEAAATALSAAMTGAWQLDVPLTAEARRGRTWLAVS
jgi:DNA polymerase-1